MTIFWRGCRGQKKMLETVCNTPGGQTESLQNNTDKKQKRDSVFAFWGPGKDRPTQFDAPEKMVTTRRPQADQQHISKTPKSFTTLSKIQKGQTKTRQQVVKSNLFFR